MSAAGGMMYTAALSSVSLPNIAGMNIWEIGCPATTSILIHSWRIEFSPQIIGGYTQDSRANLQVARLSRLGTGGTLVVARPELDRNTTPCQTTFSGMVTSPGPPSAILQADSVTTMLPFMVSRSFTQVPPKFLVPAGGMLALGILNSFGAATVLSSEIYFEEI